MYTSFAKHGNADLNQLVSLKNIDGLPDLKTINIDSIRLINMSPDIPAKLLLALYNINPETVINTPTGSVTPTGTGGTNYYYIMTGVTYSGETAYNEYATTNNTSLDSTSYYNTVTWSGTPGCSEYRIYRKIDTGDYELLHTTVSNTGTYVDDYNGVGSTDLTIKNPVNYDTANIITRLISEHQEIPPRSELIDNTKILGINTNTSIKCVWKNVNEVFVYIHSDEF